MEIQLWREFLDPYALAVDELMIKFNHLMSAFRKADDYCPIEQVQGRVNPLPALLKRPIERRFLWNP